MDNAYINRFFNIIGNEDKRLACALFPLMKHQNLIFLLNYKLTGNESTLDKVVDDSIRLASEDAISATDYYYEAGLFSILKGDLSKGRHYVEKALECANSHALELEAFGATSGVEYLSEGIEADYRYVLENINKVHSALNKAYEKFCNIENPNKAIQALAIERKLFVEKIKASIPNKNRIVN